MAAIGRNPQPVPQVNLVNQGARLRVAPGVMAPVRPVPVPMPPFPQPQQPQPRGLCGRCAQCFQAVFDCIASVVRGILNFLSALFCGLCRSSDRNMNFMTPHDRDLVLQYEGLVRRGHLDERSRDQLQNARIELQRILRGLSPLVSEQREARPRVERLINRLTQEINFRNRGLGVNPRPGDVENPPVEEPEAEPAPPAVIIPEPAQLGSLFLTLSNVQDFQRNRAVSARYLLTLLKAQHDRVGTAGRERLLQIMQRQARLGANPPQPAQPIEGMNYEAPQYMARMSIEEVVSSAGNLTPQNAPRFMRGEGLLPRIQRLRTTFQALPDNQKQQFREQLYGAAPTPLVAEALEIANLLQAAENFTTHVTGACEAFIPLLPLRVFELQVRREEPLSAAVIARNLAAIDAIDRNTPLLINRDPAMISKAPVQINPGELCLEMEASLRRNRQPMIRTTELLDAFDRLYRGRNQGDVISDQAGGRRFTIANCRDRLQQFINFASNGTPLGDEAEAYLKLIIFEFRTNRSLTEGQKTSAMLGISDSIGMCDEGKVGAVAKQYGYLKGRSDNTTIEDYFFEKVQEIKETKIQYFYSNPRRFLPSRMAGSLQPIHTLNLIRDVRGERLGLNRHPSFIRDPHRHTNGHIRDRELPEEGGFFGPSYRELTDDEHEAHFHQVYTDHPEELPNALHPMFNAHGFDQPLCGYIYDQLRRSGIAEERVVELTSRVLINAGNNHEITPAGCKFLAMHFGAMLPAFEFPVNRAEDAPEMAVIPAILQGPLQAEIERNRGAAMQGPEGYLLNLLKAHRNRLDAPARLQLVEAVANPNGGINRILSALCIEELISSPRFIMPACFGGDFNLMRIWRRVQGVHQNYQLLLQEQRALVMAHLYQGGVPENPAAAAVIASIREISQELAESQRNIFSGVYGRFLREHSRADAIADVNVLARIPQLEAIVEEITEGERNPESIQRARALVTEMQNMNALIGRRNDRLFEQQEALITRLIQNLRNWIDRA